jgi:hypothetical protein
MMRMCLEREITKISSVQACHVLFPVSRTEDTTNRISSLFLLVEWRLECGVPLQ